MGTLKLRKGFQWHHLRMARLMGASTTLQGALRIQGPEMLVYQCAQYEEQMR